MRYRARAVSIVGYSATAFVLVFALFRYAGVMILLTVGVIMFLLGLAWYWIGGRTVLTKHGVKFLSGRDCPELQEEIQGMKKKTGLKARIRLGLLDDALPNAFTLFLGPRNYLIVLSVGIFENLSEEEIEAVASHEISHIKNRDILIKSIFIPLRYLQLPTGALLESFVSRYREFRADREGAFLLGNPMTLASALIKIARCYLTKNSPDSKTSLIERSFLIADPSPTPPRRIIGKLFSRHPSIEDRVRELVTLSKEL